MSDVSPLGWEMKRRVYLCTCCCNKAIYDSSWIEQTHQLMNNLQTKSWGKLTVSVTAAGVLVWGDSTATKTQSEPVTTISLINGNSECCEKLYLYSVATSMTCYEMKAYVMQVRGQRGKQKAATQNQGYIISSSTTWWLNLGTNLSVWVCVRERETQFTCKRRSSK